MRPFEERGVIVLVLAPVLVALLAPAAPAVGKSEATYESELRAIKPPVSGLELQTSGGDQFLVLRNQSGKTAIVEGYDNDQYLRFGSNRVVEVNLRSPSKYVNEDRFGTRQPPASAVPGAKPKWQVVSRDGSYRWFDHRIHWMDKQPPPQVKDQSKETKVFDWEVPLKVDGRPVVASGTLSWVPATSSSGSSTGLIVGIVAAALVALAVLLLLLRRRRRTPVGSQREKGPKEAW
jgi:LPXTG-motif cell wall-anchored protein